MSRFVVSLTAQKITEILSRNEVHLAKDILPKCIRSIDCNQLASNRPIEDRLRISSLVLPGESEPTLIMGVFDGHGGCFTADLVTRRLFNYIALSIHPHPNKLRISNYQDIRNILNDLHSSQQYQEDPALQDAEFHHLTRFRDIISPDASISDNLKLSFNRCDEDLSEEFQTNLSNQNSSASSLRYYLSAAVSGCCALVMVVHRGIGYLASTGDCRAVLGTHHKNVISENLNDPKSAGTPIQNYSFDTIELNEEHNCDNINEIRRLARSHPKSEQNSMVKNNRLLGHLMPFRAFGDFNYKWPANVIESCNITKAFGSGVIPSKYLTPPYLIAEPDVREIKLEDFEDERLKHDKYLIVASDGLWELYESSRDVIETVIDHSMNSNDQIEDYDGNSATHILRSALRSSSRQDSLLDPEERQRLYHRRLESILTLPASSARLYHDDISIIVLKL